MRVAFLLKAIDTEGIKFQEVICSESISQQGVRGICSRRIPTGQVVEMLAPDRVPEGAEPLPLAPVNGVVIWCIPEGSGYGVGIRWVSHPSRTSSP